MTPRSSTLPLPAPVLPGAVVLCAAIAALLVGRDAVWVTSAAQVYPYITQVAALALAFRFRRSRLFVGVLSLTLLHILLAPWMLGYSRITLALAGILLPPGIALLSYLPDLPVTDARARLQFAVTLAPMIIIGGIVALQPEPASDWLLRELVDRALFASTALPQPALVVASLAVGGATFAAARMRGITETALAWLTLMMLFTLVAPVGSTARGVWVLAGALVLVVALVETSYSLAFHDELTGLPTRRALNQKLATLRPPYTVAIVDVDHFKSFNDKHGHEVGDEVLRMVATKLRAVTGGGTAYRSGGEEFTIVFPGQGRNEVTPHLENVRSAVAEARFTLRQTPRPKGKQGAAGRGAGGRPRQQLRVTISVGAASATRGNVEVATVLKAADKAMYRAKENGRNQVVA